MTQLFDNQHRSPADGMTDAEWHEQQHIDGTCRCNALYTDSTMLCDRCKRKLDEKGECRICDKHGMVATPPTVEWWLNRLRYQHQLYLAQERKLNTLGVNLMKHAIYSTWCDLAAAAEAAGDDTAIDRGKKILKKGKARTNA